MALCTVVQAAFCVNTCENTVVVFVVRIVLLGKRLVEGVIRGPVVLAEKPYIVVRVDRLSLTC